MLNIIYLISCVLESDMLKLHNYFNQMGKKVGFGDFLFMVIGCNLQAEMWVMS